jgi:hypothetical protein
MARQHSLLGKSLLGKIIIHYSYRGKTFRKGTQAVCIIGTIVSPIDVKHIKLSIKADGGYGWLVLVGPGHESVRFLRLKDYPGLDEITLHATGNFNATFFCSYERGLEIIRDLYLRYFQHLPPPVQDHAPQPALPTRRRQPAQNPGRLRRSQRQR